QSRTAMPRSDSLKMNAPSSSASSRDGSDGTLQQGVSAVGSASGFFLTTVGLAAIVNGGAAVTLGILKAVTDLPATSCDDASNTCTWGPGSGALDPNNYKLVVTKKSSPTRFEYALSGEPKTKPGSGFIVFLSG